jgi:sialate O-acetylesterase
MPNLFIINLPNPVRLAEKRRTGLLVALAFLMPAMLWADVSLAPLFRDGAVLQQKRPVTVWGRANPGEGVEVSFAGQEFKTRGGEDGRWSVTLAPLAASSEPQTLRVRAGNLLEVKDVLVGEVWLCSGQSNMEWPVSSSNDADEETAEAKYPGIREFNLPHTPSSSPQETVEGEWVACSPATVGEFTAVGYFFARQIHEELGVPVGIINSSWGGTRIESWINAEALAEVSSSDAIQERWSDRLADYPEQLEDYRSRLASWAEKRDKALASGEVYERRAPRQPEGLGSHWEPSSLFNGMIAPLAPYTIAGVLWYQGESNEGSESEYAELFATLIGQWRDSFQNASMPFYFVQLANCVRKRDESAVSWAYLREAQASVLNDPDTGMAVAIDIGESGNIHPRNKQEVGRRLSLLALRDVYGYEVEAQGPRFEYVDFSGGQAVVHFENAEGLNSGEDPLSGFFIRHPL